MASQWDRASAAWEPWLRNWHWILFLVPIAVVWTASAVFDVVVACDLIDLQFLSADLPPAPPPITPATAMAIYGWGLGFVALLALAVLTWVLAARLVLQAVPGPGGGWLLLVMILGSAAVVLWCGAAGWAPGNCISRALAAGTLHRLPPGSLARVANIDAAQAWGAGAVLAAGLAAALAAAVSVQAAVDEAVVRRRAQYLRHMMLAAAAGLVVSILTVHLYFEVGAQVLAQHGAALAERFEALRLSVELYWGVIASLALLALYFPAAAVLWLRLPETSRAQEGGLPLVLFTRLLAVVSPLLAGAALEIVNAIAGSIGS